MNNTPDMRFCHIQILTKIALTKGSQISQKSKLTNLAFRNLLLTGAGVGALFDGGPVAQRLPLRNR